MPPNVPRDIIDEIRALTERVRLLEGRSQIRPALSEIKGGTVTISENGQLIVRSSDGDDILFIGRVSPDHSDGSPQQGTIIRREDGTAALSVWSSTGAGAQPIVLWDRNGAGIIAEDLAAGGLAAPFLSASGWYGAGEVPAYSTSSGTFTTLMTLPYIKQNPRVRAYYLVKADPGTAGEIRLVDGSGTAVGPTVTVGSGGFSQGYVEGVVPGAHESEEFLRWQARATSGGGSIGVKGLTTYGIKS